MSLLVVASAMAAAVPVTASPQQAEGYSGTHVSFDTGSNAVLGYTVNGKTLVENLTVQSKSKARSGGIGVGADLSSVTRFSAAGMSMGSKSQTSATVSVETGAKMTAHDNGRGILVVRSNGKSHYIRANISSESEAEQAGENRVLVTTGDGTQAAFLVVGDGKVTVNKEGDVVADIGENGKLCYRQYKGDRGSNDKKQERLITDGKAAAEVYIQQTTEGGEKLAADVVKYSEDTTVKVTEKAKGNVEMTVERSRNKGKVVITTVSEQAFQSTQNIQVQVDGEAAARAESYSAVRQATQGGDSSKFLVHQSSSAKAMADVVVGINHFSERTVTMTSGDSGGDAGDGGEGGDGDEQTANGGAGFGALAALAAIGAALIAARRR